MIVRGLLQHVRQVVETRLIWCAVAACIHVCTHDANSPASPAEICGKNAAVTATFHGLDPKAVLENEGTSPPTTRIWLSVNRVSRVPSPEGLMCFSPTKTLRG